MLKKKEQTPAPETATNEAPEQSADQTTTEAQTEKQDSSGLGTVVIRNEFYRDGYRSLLKMTLIQSIAILGLIGAMYYIIKIHQPKHFYFATTEDRYALRHLG